MGIIIEKVVAGEDSAKSQEEFAAALLNADEISPSKEFLEAREAKAYEEAEMNLRTNALIFPLPGETIATRVVTVPDEVAAGVEGGFRVVEKEEFINNMVESLQPNFEKNLEDGTTEEDVDKPTVSMAKELVNKSNVVAIDEVSRPPVKTNTTAAPKTDITELTK